MRTAALDIGAFVSVVMIGFWLGAAFMRWKVREQLTLAIELRDASREWHDRAVEAKEAAAEHREVAEAAKNHAEESWIRAAEYEQSAHDELERARALYAEFTS